jgi:hypothetical protein
MSDPTNKPQPFSSPQIVTSERLEALANKHSRGIGAGLFAGTGLSLLYVLYRIVLFFAVQERQGLTGGFVLVLLLCGIWAGAGVLWRVTGTGKLTPGEKLRLTLVLVGGLSGLVIAFFGLSVPFSKYSEVFSGGFKEWRKHPVALILTGIPLFGGLILAFISLLLTSGLEHSSALARRLLYGYNAVLSGVLLLFIFVLLNVLPYSGIWPFKALAQTSDWTSSSMYSLSEATKDRLSSLEKSVKVYVILSAGDPLNNSVDTLMQNCREVTNLISWESLSPQINMNAVIALEKKYPITSEGLLVLYGDEGKQVAEFIPRKDLSSTDRGGETPRVTFKGEAALTKTLTYLAEGKTKPVVYFTQGHGEFKFDDQANRPGQDEGFADMVRKMSESMSVVVKRIGQSNFDVKPLTFDAKGPKVPDDADVVVIARPVTEFSSGEIAALRKFATAGDKKKGKLFILFDVVPTSDGKMAKTGLEGLAAEFGVQVGNDRIIAVGARTLDGIRILPQGALLVNANPNSSNRIAKKFAAPGKSPSIFIFNEARPVSALPQAPGGGRYTVEDLIVLSVPNDQRVMTDSDLNADPDDVAARVRNNDAELAKRELAEPPSFAVAVSEGDGAAPQIPGHDFMKRETKPRALVFGDAGWASNVGIAQRGESYDLFVSCLNWLYERPEIGVQAVADKVREEYRLPRDVSGVRLLLSPVLYILVTVVCAGTGVWIVRRR